MTAPTYRRLTPLFLGLLILLLVAGSCYRYTVWRDKEQRHLASSLMQLETSYRAGVNMFGLATATYFDEIINRHEVRTLLVTALAGNERERSLARGRLYRLLYPSFQRLSQRNLRHLHFHLPDGTSFLRFHRPDHHGDLLTDVQPSARHAISKLVPVHGFEIGKSGSAFRNIYPLLHNGEYLGSVDLSVPFKSLRNELVELMPAREFTYILDKNGAVAALTDQLDLYTDTPLHPQFLVEDSYLALPDSLPPPSATAVRINTQLQQKQHFQSMLLQGDSFSVTANLDNMLWAVNLMRIYDVDNKPVGYLISYAPDDFLQSLKYEYLISLVVVWILAFGIGFLFILLARSRDEMARLATTDPLTGLANRRSFMERMEQEMERFRRYGAPVGLLMLDIDYFKKINDSYGHAVGDEVLCQFAKALLQNLRQIDLVGRLGGEEFAVLLPGTDLEGAKLFAERLLGVSPERQQNDEPGHMFQTTAGLLKITTSIGVSRFSEDDTSVDVILSRADEALYQAKGNGRNRVETI